jgi:hypothetical protein
VEEYSCCIQGAKKKKNQTEREGIYGDAVDKLPTLNGRFSVAKVSKKFGVRFACAFALDTTTMTSLSCLFFFTYLLHVAQFEQVESSIVCFFCFFISSVYLLDVSKYCTNGLDCCRKYAECLDALTGSSA